MRHLLASSLLAAGLAGLLPLPGCGGTTGRPAAPDAGFSYNAPQQDAGQQEDPDAGTPDAGTVPGSELGTGDPASVTLTEIAGFDAGLRRPRDLAFNPRRPDELWIVNNGENPTVGEDSVVIVFDASSPARTTERRKDAFAMHFMPFPSSLAFGADPTTIGKEGTFATCHESRNTYGGQAQPNDFMGPALWSSDLEVFARHDPKGLGSHLDMLHGSPNCMGIAHERDNVYWVFGGKSHATGGTAGQMPVPAIVRYDFGEDHGIGEDDHADGLIHQYVTLQVSRVPGVPSHLVFEPQSKLLYIADTGNARVAALDTLSGTQGRALQGMEPLVGYYMMEDATLQDVVAAQSGQLELPSGIELHNGLLFVSDNKTGRITAFTLFGQKVNDLDTGLGEGALAGIAFGPDGKLYFVDMKGHRVLRIDPR
jgi:hypothetical protein